MNVKYAKEIDISNIEYSDVKSYGDHANIVYLQYEEGPIILQTPFMKMPYGMNNYKQDNGKSKYSLQLSFGNNESDKMNEFKSLLEKIDEKVINDGVKNSTKWLKRKIKSADAAQALFTGSIKVSTENGEPTDKYPPTFKVNVQVYNDQAKFNSYNTNKEVINSNDLLANENPLKGQNARAIVKLGGIWLAGGKFGIIWNLEQLNYDESMNKIKGYAFNDDSDEDGSDNEIKNELSSPVNSESSAIEKNDYVIDSEEDDL